MYQWPGEIPWEEYIRLYFVEKTLRLLIKNELEKTTARWWVQRLPSGVREDAEKNRQNQKQYLSSTQNLHPLWYVNFMSYAEIITRRDNWEECFKPIFRNRDHLRTLLEMLHPVRNEIAHMRPLSTGEKKNLDALSEDVLKPVWDHYNTRYVKPAQELMRERRHNEAEKILLRGFEQTDKDPWIACNLGDLYTAVGRLEEAEKWLDYAEKHLPLDRYKQASMEKLIQIREKIRLKRVKLCPSCGSEVPKENPFCGKCGYKF